MHDIGVFTRRESEVRGYCRSFPIVFQRALGAHLYDEHDRRFIDFLCGAGSLNYGHNHPALKAAITDYLAGDGIVHSLDLHTGAKRDFLTAFERCVLTPRGLDYKLQFCGPTGTNAVEAAFKLARRVTGRPGIISFTNGFHGVTQGALAATGNAYMRNAAGAPLGGVTHLPFDGWLGPSIDTVRILERYLDDPSSGVDLPAAVIVETVQGEGGINVAGDSWLRRLSEACAKRKVLLIVDDIQVGCGRTGAFFSFERAGIVPDIVVLAKSLSGFGLPLAVVLMKPEHDQWQPAEHNGTFRGPNLAFVAATAALETFWADDALTLDVQRKGRELRARLRGLRERFPDAGFTVRGRGLIVGLHCAQAELAGCIQRQAFGRGLIIERCGPNDEVVKCMPPLTIPDAVLHEALDILDASVAAAVGQRRPALVATEGAA